jgi:hypothetical protein
MSTRNWIAVGLTLVSLAVIIPGLRSDALTITATIPLLKKPLYEETQSILRAIRRLYDSKNYFVAGLILLFSVIVPFIKAAMMAVSWTGCPHARAVSGSHPGYGFVPRTLSTRSARGQGFSRLSPMPASNRLKARAIRPASGRK